ncbi:hypothetical protein [Phocaeicola dorei]|jgi:hypothetical protein|uniref:hypothetical protein n=1 Tax=Phocaeicola dorei TaxID=357276 RepID=UPI001C99A985|nr:hypothetical protein [Phocaeicola dorei]
MIVGHQYLTIPNNPIPIELIDITLREYSALLSDSAKVHEFVYYERRIKEIKMNVDAFFDAKRYYTNLYEKNFRETINYDYKEEAYIELNRCLINFIASFKSFVEHCENRIKNIFGNTSEEVIKFKSYLSHLFDNNFSYRFFIKLRDYAIHVGYPIEEVLFSRYTFNPHNTDCWYEVQTMCSKNKLSSSNTFNAKIRGEIGRVEEPFDVSLFIFDVYNLTLDVFKKFTTIASNEFIEPANRLIALSETHHQENLSVTISKIEGGRIYFHSKLLPIDLAKRIIVNC